MKIIQTIDLRLHDFFISVAQSREWLYDFMHILTTVFSPESLLIVGVLGVFYFIYKKHWKIASTVALSLGGGLSWGLLIKTLVMRPRPEQALVIETGYSFPSNHALAATIFFILLISIFAYKIQSTLCRRVFVTSSIGLIILTALSRVYLGVHWFSDIVTGMLLGAIWTLFVMWLVGYISKRYSL